MTQEFHSFNELKSLLPKGKKKKEDQIQTKADTRYTKSNDTDFARFARFEKKAKNQQIQVKISKTKKEELELEEDID